MANDLQALEEWAAPLLSRMDVKERRRLARTIATELRRSQRDRIKAQRNPDGTPYAPRKPQQWRNQQGAIRRRAMYSKLRTNKWLKATTQGDTAVVGFFGSIARIARTHQYGLRDRVSKNGTTIEYARRELIGFTPSDRELVRDLLIDHLGSM